MTTTEHSNVWVCVDCYFAHHYGARFHCDTCNVENCKHDGAGWYAGDSDTPYEREPLALLETPGMHVSDNTCSNHSVEDLYDEDGDRTGDTTVCDFCRRDGYETGTDEFSWRRCEGCGSSLGGSRYRLAVWS